MQRIGEAFATNLDLSGLVTVLTRGAADAFGADAARGCTLAAGGTRPVTCVSVREWEFHAEALGAAAAGALSSGRVAEVNAPADGRSRA